MTKYNEIVIQFKYKNTENYWILKQYCSDERYIFKLKLYSVRILPKTYRYFSDICSIMFNL